MASGDHPTECAGPQRSSSRQTKRTSLMLLWVVLGTLFALSHHYANEWLSGQSTANYPQRWVNRFSVVTAFLVKCSLASAVGMSFNEMLWRSFYSRYTTIDAISKLFTVQSKPKSFLCLDALRTAPLALLIAGIQWSVPLAAIITPGTLNVHIVTKEDRKSQCHVPTFNQSLGELWFPGGLGAKVDDTPKLNRLSYQTVVPGSVVYVPASSFCGSNCSYTQEFVGPQMNCGYNNTLTPKDIGVENYRELRYCYLQSDTGCRLYVAPTLDSAWTLDDELGRRWSLAYAVSKEAISDSEMRINYSKIECNYTYAIYNLSVEYVNDLANYTISMTPYSLPQNFTPDHMNYPTEDLTSWHIDVTSRGLFQYFYVVWLRGWSRLFKDSSSEDVTKVATQTNIYYTPLVQHSDDLDFIPAEDLTTSIPDLFVKFIISTFLLNSTNTVVTTCHLRLTDQTYYYEPWELVTAYATAIALSFLCVLGGIFAMKSNGEPVKDIFSQILMTTRNRELEAVVVEERNKVEKGARLKLEKARGHSAFVVEHRYKPLKQDE